MRPSPSGLTLLAKQHGGEFPLDIVVKTIDGRGMPRGHGDPWMPVWGTVLSEELAGAAKPKATVEEKLRDGSWRSPSTCARSRRTDPTASRAWSGLQTSLSSGTISHRRLRRHRSAPVAAQSGAALYTAAPTRAG